MAGEPGSLDNDEGLERRRHRHWYDRLMMLADGVFAIAITLLAADVMPATVSRSSAMEIWAALAPQLDAYALSFVVISVYWLAHRRFMAMILTVDAPVTVLTLAMLGLVALLPAFTRMADSQGGSPPAMLVYGALVVSIGVSLALLWGYAALVANRVSPEVPMRARWFYFALIVVTPPLFLGLLEQMPHPPIGAVPAVLALLFLVGWRMRQWTLRRLGPAPREPAL